MSAFQFFDSSNNLFDSKIKAVFILIA